MTIRKIPSGYRAVSAWSGAEIARSVYPVGTLGFKVSALAHEAEARKEENTASGVFGIRGRVEE